MKLTYSGPHEGVNLLALGVKVTRGKSIEVDDPEIAASLLEQGWTEAKPTKPKATAPAKASSDAPQKEK